MVHESWRLVLLIALIVAALWWFRRRPGRAGQVCARCGFASRRGTPACPRCGRALDTSAIELERLEAARRRGAIGERAYRRRKLALIRGETGEGAGHRDSG